MTILGLTDAEIMMGVMIFTSVYAWWVIVIDRDD